jgi:cell wall-associated NlpC family hydrolase
MSTRFRSRIIVLVLTAATAAALVVPVAGQAESEKGPRVAEMIEPVAAPSRAERAVKVALGVVGTPYRWGGESPSTGFDCSGLVRWAYGRVGVDLPHNSYALYGEGRRVSEARMEPGDILFFEGLGHVGLYLGSGRMVHSPETGRTVEVVRLTGTNYGTRLIGARRVTAA